MIVWSVDFALLLYDEFNGAKINDASVIFRTEGRMVTPLRKNEGFYVFRNMGKDALELEISRPRYLAHRLQLDKNTLDPLFPVVSVRLLRDHSNSFPDCEWIDGTCQNSTDVIALATHEPSVKIHSIEQQDAGTTIGIQGFTVQRLLGYRFALGEDKESFVISQKLSSNSYQTDSKLTRPHKAGEALSRVYLTKSDSKGNYHIPVELGQKARITKVFQQDKEKSKWVPVSVTAPS